jgi:hypothetical protein
MLQYDDAEGTVVTEVSVRTKIVVKFCEKKT